MLCLGIDSGTGSSKAPVLDIESGEFIALAHASTGRSRACLRRMSNRSQKPGQKPPVRRRRMPRPGRKTTIEIKASGASG